MAAASRVENTSGSGGDVPAAVMEMGWSWGAFQLAVLFAIANRVWGGLLALIPLIGLIARVCMGIDGHRLAWRNRSFEDVDHFQETMSVWNIWGQILFTLDVVLIVGWLLLWVGRLLPPLQP